MAQLALGLETQEWMLATRCLNRRGSRQRRRCGEHGLECCDLVGQNQAKVLARYQLILDQISQVKLLGQHQHVVIDLLVQARRFVFVAHKAKTALDLQHVQHGLKAALALQPDDGVHAKAQ